jgi:methionyl-tRNA formyltransferase
MSKPLNVLLFAFGSAGVASIRGLQNAGHHITGCVTHKTIQPWLPSVEDECRRLDIECSTDVANGPVQPTMADRPDVVLSVFYRRRIEMPFLGLAKIGAFNVAASQLPRYRGAFPFRWAILNNETMWGVTVHQMTASYCDGAVLHRRPLIVKPAENAYDLFVRVSDAAATAAVEAVDKLARGDDHLTSVDPAGSQFFDATIPYGGRIDWNQSAARIDSFVRALDFGRQVIDTYQHLTPPAQASIGAKSIGIWRARFGGTMSSYPPGTITRCDDQVWVQAARGHLVIDRVVVDGVNWNAAEYFRHRGHVAGDQFDLTDSWNTPTLKELSHAA